MSLLSAGFKIFGDIFAEKERSKGFKKARGFTEEAQTSSLDAVRMAAEEATTASRDRYGEFQSAIQPYISGGTSAYNQLLGQYGLAPPGTETQDLSQTQAFQVPFEAGIGRAKQDLASSGMLFSGPAVQEYMDQSFGTYYNDIMNPLRGMAQGGQEAVMGMGQLGSIQAGQEGGIARERGGREAGIYTQGGQDFSNLALGKSISKGQMFSSVGGHIGGEFEKAEDAAAELMGWNI